MRRPVISFLAACLLLVLNRRAGAQIAAAVDAVKPVSVSLMGGYWFPRLDSRIQVSNGGVTGTLINATDALGIENDSFFEIRGGLTLLGSHHLNFRYLPIRYSGDRVISQSITFAGQTYTAGTRVVSNLDADYFRLGYQYDLIRLPVVSLGLQFDARYFAGEARLASSIPAIDEKKEGRFGFPTVGIAARVHPLPYISGEAEVGGVSAGRYGHFIEAEGAIVFTPVRYVSIAGGYRILDFAAKNRGDQVDLRLQGPFIKGTVRF